MAINKKLITFAKKQTFLGANGINGATTPTNGLYGQIPATSIVFIKDTGEIWQNGKYYGSIDEQTSPADSNVDNGFVFKDASGKYWRRTFSLWGNTFDGSDPSIDDDLKVGGTLRYGAQGIHSLLTQIPTPVLTINTTYDVTIPSGALALNGGDFTISNNGTLKFKVERSTGNLQSMSGYLQGNHVRNTPLYIDATQTKGVKWTDIKQYDAASNTVSLASSIPAYITIQEGPHSSDYSWKPWIADSDSTSKASWGIGLSGDAFYIGRVSNTQATNALSNSWVFDSSGYITAKGYKIPSGTSSGFLKADGSVDLNTYLTSVAFSDLTNTPTTLSGYGIIDSISIIDLEDNGTTTAGTWLAKPKNGTLSAYTDGLVVRYKIEVAGASTTTLNISGIGSKTVYRAGSTKLTTHYGVGSYILLYYSTTLNNGSWQVFGDYDANSYAYVRQYVSTDNVDYPLLVRYRTTAIAANSYDTAYSRFVNSVTLNPSTGVLTANAFKVIGGTSSGFLKADGSIDTNSYINDGWIINYSPTSVAFSNGAWVNSGINFSNYTAMTTGSYLLLLDDGGTYYTGVFSYYNGNINTDEEVLLHAAGNRTIYVSDDIHGRANKPGVLYAKLKSNGSAPALYLAYSHSVTINTITIKIKKLAAI